MTYFSSWIHAGMLDGRNILQLFSELTNKTIWLPFIFQKIFCPSMLSNP